MPVNEVQVRSTTAKNTSTEYNEQSSKSLFNWELIHLHLKSSQSGATQRRTEKVYQLANTYELNNNVIKIF